MLNVKPIVTLQGSPLSRFLAGRNDGALAPMRKFGCSDAFAWDFECALHQVNASGLRVSMVEFSKKLGGGVLFRMNITATTASDVPVLVRCVDVPLSRNAREMVAGAIDQTLSTFTWCALEQMSDMLDENDCFEFSSPYAPRQYDKCMADLHAVESRLETCCREISRGSNSSASVEDTEKILRELGCKPVVFA